MKHSSAMRCRDFHSFFATLLMRIAAIHCEVIHENDVTFIGATLIRLMGGSVPNEGRVEVYHEGQWGTLCDDHWDDQDATVACGMLGYRTGTALSKLEFGAGEGPIWLDNLGCSGTEQSLAECPHNGWGQHNCGHNEDASIICRTLPGPMELPPDLRLVGGRHPAEGRVEVLYDGRWGTVCDDWFENVDARVVCGQFGFRDGVAVSYGEFGEGLGPIWLDSVACSGQEATLMACPHDPWGVHDCTHAEDAGVRCAEEILEQNIRLSGGTGEGAVSLGRVEVLHEGQWGTVCDDEWDDLDARVVCGMLGYTRGQAMTDNEFGEGSGPIWLDNVGCIGLEQSLEDCLHNGWGVTNCGHHEDAGVLCMDGWRQQPGPGAESLTDPL